MKYVKDKAEMLSDVVEVDIEYALEEGYFDANIMLDGHCVAYFNDEGELQLLPFEVRRGNTKDMKVVDQLRAKGIKLTKKKATAWDEYYIKVSR